MLYEQRKTLYFLHFWHQCPSASQQTGSEEPNTGLSMVLLALVTSKSSNVISNTPGESNVFLGDSFATSLQIIPILIASVINIFHVNLCALINRTAHGRCLTWPWRGREVWTYWCTQTKSSSFFLITPPALTNSGSYSVWVLLIQRQEISLSLGRNIPASVALHLHGD